MKLSDKISKFKQNLFISKNKEAGEEAGKMAEHTSVEDSSGKEVSKFIKKDGKLHSSEASQEAQESGVFEAAAKKAGVKKDDLVFTSATMVAGQAAVSEDKERKKKESHSDSHDSEKAELLGKSEDIPKSVSAMHMDGDLDVPHLAHAQIKLHNKAAMSAQDRETRKWHMDQSEQIYNHMTGKKPYTPPVHKLDKADTPAPKLPKQHTLNYKEINAPKVDPTAEAKTIDYSKLEAPARNPIWRKRLEQSKIQKVKRLEAAGKVEGGMVKSEKLEKDVVDFKTGKTIVEDKKKERPKEQPKETQKPTPGAKGFFDILGRKNKAPDTRSTDEKIRAALESQADTNPYASRRDQQSSPRGFANPATQKPEKKEGFVGENPATLPKKGINKDKVVSLFGVAHQLPKQEPKEFGEYDIERSLARHDDEKHINSVREANKKGTAEPYIGPSIQGETWATHKHDKNILIQSPSYNVDPKLLGGHLGKHVAQGGPDPFAWMDVKHKATQKLLDEVKGMPLTISTRSDLIAHDDYMSKLDPRNHKIRMHIAHYPSEDQSLAHKYSLERATPSTSRRLKAAKKLKDAGFNVTIVHDKIAGAPEEHNNHIPLDFLRNNPDFADVMRGTKHETNAVIPDNKAISRLKAAGIQMQETKKPKPEAAAPERTTVPTFSKLLFELDKKLRAEKEAKKPLSVVKPEKK